MRRSADGLGEVLDVAVGEALDVGLAVEHLERGDLVLVLVEEGFEALDGLRGSGLGIDHEGGGGDRVDAGVVDRLLEAALHVHELLPQRGVGGQRHDGRLEERGLGGRDGVDAGVDLTGGRAGLGEMAVGVDGVDEGVLDGREALAGGRLEAGELVGTDAALDAGQA